MRFCITVSLLFLLSVNTVCALDGDVDGGSENIFFKANQFYFNGEFEKAVQLYESILKNHQSNLIFQSESRGELFYNIGNCYFRSGQKGNALLNYERARRFIPRDADLKYNIEYVHDLTEDNLSQPENIISEIFGVNFFSQTELATVFCLVNLMLFLFLTIRIFFRAEWIFYVIIIFSICWIVSGISFGIMLKQTIFDDRVVILAKEVDVLAGPDKEDTLLFKVHEGTLAYQERNESGFSLIRLPDSKRGWLVSSAIEAIYMAGAIQKQELEGAKLE
ncbi:MAG: tetratricopeptide repeat protein [Deltaproteobacteria bacterium]|nr:tetratricopeptide repeat protein [Deltaproteobacteria bacterium]